MDPVLIDSSNGCIVQSWADLKPGVSESSVPMQGPGAFGHTPLFSQGIAGNWIESGAAGA